MNCYSERIPRRFCLTAVLRGLRDWRASLKTVKFLTVEDSLQLAAGSFNRGPRELLSLLQVQCHVLSNEIFVEGVPYPFFLENWVLNVLQRITCFERPCGVSGRLKIPI